MTLGKAVFKGTQHSISWRTLVSITVLSAAIVGCKSQQSQSQPPAQPSQSSSSSSSQSQSSSSSSSSSSSRSQPQTASSSTPSSSSSRQPSQSMPGSTSRQPSMDMPTIESGQESSDAASTASGSEQSSQRRGSAGDSMPDPSARSRTPPTEVYSESDQRPEDRRMPPDPSTKSQGEPPDEVDFSEEEQTASSSASSSSASSSSASSSNSSASSASASSSSSSGQPASSSGSPARSGGAPNEAPSTSAERVAELEGQFDSTMVSYDGMILRERDYVRNRPSSAQGEDDEAMDEPPPGESLEDLIESAEAEIPPPPGGGGEGGSGPEQNNSSGQATGPGLPTAGRKGEYNHTNSPTVVPADIPSGNDDDVVARQIREAAMRESDPELREKLWEEYRKYKNAQK